MFLNIRAVGAHERELDKKSSRHNGVSGEVGLDEYFADILPQDKAGYNAFASTVIVAINAQFLKIKRK